MILKECLLMRLSVVYESYDFAQSGDIKKNSLHKARSGRSMETPRTTLIISGTRQTHYRSSTLWRA